MHLDVEIAGVLALPGLGRAGHGHDGARLVLRDDAQLAGALGHEQAAVGQEREAPRRLDVPRDHLDPERLLLALDLLSVPVGHEGRTRLHVGALLLQVGHELPDLLVGQLLLERNHLGLRHAVGDDPGDALIVFRPDPLVVEEIGRAPGRGVGAVAGRAALGVERHATDSHDHRRGRQGPPRPGSGAPRRRGACGRGAGAGSC